MKVISSKITIPIEAPHISRSRLLDALQGSLNSGSSTVISGRAGTGKTMLATDFARGCGRQAAWYKVDAPEVNLPEFMEYLVASVARVSPGFGVKTLTRHRQSFGPNVSELVESFIYDLERLAEPLLVVFDDLHLVYDAEWVVPFFQRMLTLLPAEAHMLILGRGLPPAPLWRLRSKQRLCVINEQMLAFNETESESLFAYYGLDPQQASQALLQTGGRASALHAAAMRAGEACVMN